MKIHEEFCRGAFCLAFAFIFTSC